MLRCLIIDDEPLALKLLTDYVGRSAHTSLIEAYTNPITALQSIDTQPPDLILLDVQMPELTGVQFAKIVRGKYPVIITTAYPDYALEGYELDIVDYLLKPISFERFERAVLKVLRREPPAPPTASMVDFLFIKSGYKIQRIDLEDILYLEGLSDYVRIQTTAGPVLTLDTLRNFAESLPSAQFMRVHRSWIVALARIDYIERNRIVIGNQRIPIGATYQKAFWEKIEPGI